MEEIRNKGRHTTAPPVESSRDVNEELEELNDDEHPNPDSESGIDDRDKGHIKEPHARKESEEGFEETPEPEDAEKGVNRKKHKPNKVKYHQRMNRGGRPPIRIPVPNGLQAKRAQDNKF